MPQRYFEQRRINANVPPNWDSSSATTIQLFLHMTKRGELTYMANTQLPGKPGEPPIITRQLDFAIWTKYVLVEMHLMSTAEVRGWRWSTSLDAFTTKDSARTAHYGHLHYKENPGSNQWVKADEWVDARGLYLPATSVQFKAKQKGGSKKDYHAFSLNLELLQPNGQWLPITIDPDVRNPPTGSDKLTKARIEQLKSDEKRNQEKIFELFSSTIGH